MGSDPGEALKEISPGWPKATAQALDHATARWWWWLSHQVMSDSCDPMDCSLPGSSVHGILQARILEWIAISFSGWSSWPRNWTDVSFTAGRFFTGCCEGRPPEEGLPKSQTLVWQIPSYQLLHCCFYLIPKSCLTLCDPMDYSLPGSSVHGISQQEYWRGLPFPSPGDLPDRGVEPAFPALTGWFFTAAPPGKPSCYKIWNSEIQ